MKRDQKDHYIFYIQYTKKLPSTFFALDEELKKYGVMLVPITPGQLPSMAKAKKQVVISTTADLNSYNGLMNLRKRFLDFALLNQKFCLMDISSFGKIPIAYKLENNYSYFHYPLPMAFRSLAESIAAHYFSQTAAVKQWPGGRRAKLPPMA